MDIPIMVCKNQNKQTKYTVSQFKLRKNAKERKDI